jgi:kynurenine formamidase
MAIYQLRNLDKWVKKVGGDAEKVTRAVALQMTNEVIQRTRVDTGRARGNWHAEINQAEEKVFEFAGGGHAAIPFALSHCNQATEKMYGHRWILSNNLAYISSLESLDSMVRGTVLEFNRAIDAAVKGL